MEIGITNIGANGIGRACAVLIAQETNNVCDLHNVVDSQFADLKEEKPYLITRLPDLPDVWIDSKVPIVNYKKHYNTCLNNRKKRKKRKRR